METIKIAGHTGMILIGSALFFLVLVVDGSQVEKWDFVISGIVIGWAIKSVFAIGDHFLDKRLDRTRKEIRELLDEKRRLGMIP